MDHLDMPIYQTPSDLSRQDPHENESFTSAYSLPHYPLTPYPIVPETRDWSPSAFGTWDNRVQTTGPEIKQRARTHFYAPSASGLCHSSPTPSLNISSTELQRVLDSLLDQIDWLEVAVKVGKNRAPLVYCDAIEKILLAHIYQLVKAEGGDDAAAEFENGDEDKEYVHMDDEHEGTSEASRKSEDEGGDSDEDNCEYDDKDMQGDDEEEDDEMDDGEYKEDDECSSV